MSSLNTGSTSNSEGDLRYAMMDEKKRKRMISNRDSARRSRMRKQKLVNDLGDEVSRLQAANKGIVSHIDEITERYSICNAENNVLKAQVAELTERLNSLNDLIKGCGLGLDVDVTEVADPLLKPWQTMCPMQPIPASSGLLKF